MPAIRDFSQAYGATTTFRHVEAPMPDYATGDLLLALISTDDSAGATMAATQGGLPVGHVFYNDDTAGTPAWTDYTVQANESTTGDWFTTPLVPTVNDTINFGSATKFDSIKIMATVLGAGGTAAFTPEYYNGSVWGTLTTTVNTIAAWKTPITVHGEIAFTPPADWATVAVNGVTEYWIRVRCTTAGTFTTRPTFSQAWITPVLNGNNGWRLLYSYLTGTTPSPTCAMWKIAGASEVDTTFFYPTAETSDVELISIRDVEAMVDTGPAALTINVTAATGTFVRTAGSFVTDGFVAGMTIQTSGFTNGGNNTSKIIQSISTTTIANDTITVTSITGLVNESGNANERVISFPFNGLGFANSNNNLSKNTLPTMVTDKNNCLIIWYAVPDAVSVPSIIEGPCCLIAGKDGSAHADGCAWGFQAVAGTTATVTESAMAALVTEMAVIAINPPATGATVIPGYCSADASVYVSPFTGAAYNSDSVPAATITTPFTGTINGRPLANGGATVTRADSGINSYHAMTNFTGVATSGTYAGIRCTIVARTTLASKNILFHIQPYLPVDIQTTDSVALLGAMGVAIGLASTAGNFKVWHVGGTGTSWGTQRHQPVVINTDATAGLLQTTGTLNTASIAEIGLMVSGKIVAPNWLIGSIWALDTCTIAGGNAAEPLNLPQIVRSNADGHERRSSILEGAGQALFLGPIQIGDGGTNPVYLGLDSTAIEFPRQYNKDAKEVYYNSVDNFAGLIYYPGATDTISHKNSVVSSPSRYKWGLHASASASATYNFSGLSVIGAGTITLNKAVTITGLTVNNYSTIDASGLTLNGSTIINTPATNDSITTNSTTAFNTCAIDVTDVTAGNRLLSTATPDKFTTCTITGSHVSGHALRITAAGTYSMVGNIFTNFGPTERSFNTGTGIVNATDVITLDAAHGYSSGDPAYYQKQGGTAAVGLTDGNLYYVRNESSTTITLYDTSAHAIAGGATGRVDLTSAGTETHYIYSAGAAIYNNSGGLVTLNVSGGGTAPTIRESNGSSTVINNTVTVKVTVKDEGNNNVQNARVAIYKSSDMTEILNALSDVNGIAQTTSYNYLGDTAVVIRVRKSSSAPKFIPVNTSGTITSTGLNTTITFIADTVA